MDEKNLDIYGSPPIHWTRAVGQLQERDFHGGRGTFWLSTTCPDGSPHAAGVLGVWIDDTLYFASGVRTRKSRNLQANPHCAVSASLPDLDVVIEGTARRITEPAVLEKIAAEFERHGWPVTVNGDILTAPWGAPSAPPPWYLYAVTPTTAVGVATAATPGATRWRFS
jgi:hypothetical protein